MKYVTKARIICTFIILIMLLFVFDIISITDIFEFIIRTLIQFTAAHLINNLSGVEQQWRNLTMTKNVNLKLIF